MDFSDDAGSLVINDFFLFFITSNLLSFSFSLRACLLSFPDVSLICSLLVVTLIWSSIPRLLLTLGRESEWEGNANVDRNVMEFGSSEDVGNQEKRSLDFWVSVVFFHFSFASQLCWINSIQLIKY